MKITIYGGFYHVLARKSQHFSHMLCTIILWKICLGFHDLPSMFCGRTLTNAPSVMQTAVSRVYIYIKSNGCAYVNKS